MTTIIAKDQDTLDPDVRVAADKVWDLPGKLLDIPGEFTAAVGRRYAFLSVAYTALVAAHSTKDRDFEFYVGIIERKLERIKSYGTD